MKTPIFVYGTLRTGLHNYNRILKGNVSEAVEAKLENFDMYSIGGAYPAIVAGKGEVVGELIEVNDEHYDETMRALDHLEGYFPRDKRNSMYLRETLTVTTADGEKVEAYVYLWNRPVPATHIPSGDWVDYKFGGLAV